MQPSLQLSRCTWISQSPRYAVREPVPDPDRNAFERRSGEPVDVIQQSMVQGILGIADRCGQIIEMKNVTGGGIRLALDDHASAERMAMHARVRRPCRC